MNKTVAFIPARGSSKSIPLKNIKEIKGRPLIYWTLDAAVASKNIKKVFVSTDSPLIKKVVEDYNSSKIKIISRSPEVSSDQASTESVMLEFADTHTFQHIVLIQATSPLLTVEDLDKGIEEYFRSKADSLCSVSVLKKFRWKKAREKFYKPANYNPLKRPLRQEWSGDLVENGAFYITSRKAFLKSKCRLSGRIHCALLPERYLFELDDPEDCEIIEALLMKYKGKPRKTLKDTKLFISDVDGVLTDAGMYYSENGDELKKFNTRDGMGFKILREEGIKTALITTENTRIVERRSQKLKVDFTIQECPDKQAAAKELCRELGISLKNAVFIGDDINDLTLLESVGFSACPSNAQSVVKKIVDHVCSSRGGEGCAREIVDLITGDLANRRR
jgi:N-acylneuraminate cytidylyltransferase